MKRLKSRFNKLEETVCVIVFIFIFIIMSWQVLARQLRIPNKWSEELTRYLCFWLAFISASYAIQKKAHICIDAAVNIFPKKVRPYVIFFGYLILIAYCAWVSYEGFRFTESSFKMATIAPSLGGFPMWPFYLSLPVAHILMIVRCIQILLEFFKDKSSIANSLETTEI